MAYELYTVKILIQFVNMTTDYNSFVFLSTRQIVFNWTVTLLTFLHKESSESSQVRPRLRVVVNLGGTDTKLDNSNASQNVQAQKQFVFYDKWCSSFIV